MSVDLGDYVDQIQDQVNPPGVTLFPNASEEEWIRRLASGFWNARIEGITALDAFTEVDGEISPQSGTDEISRDLIQLIIVWTAFTAIANQLGQLRTQFKAVAGPVSIEQQYSATVLKERLSVIKEQKGLILERLSDVGMVTPQVFDMLAQQDQSAYLGVTEWVGSTGVGSGGSWHRP